MKLISLTMICLSVGFSGCQKSKSKLSDPVRWTGQTVNQSLTDGSTTYKILSVNKLTPLNLQLHSADLILGFPKKSLGEQHVFGGLVTEISDPSESIGGLKMSQMPGLNVVLKISADEKTVQFLGCATMCSETTPREVLYNVPLLSQDAEYVYLDLAAFGKSLDVNEVAEGGLTDSRGETKVMGFDFSTSTLVFDVKTSFVNPEEIPYDVVIRYYLKSGSGFNPAFVPRLNTEGVGYFTSYRAPEELIHRFSLTAKGEKALIKYYIKAVPTEFKPAFADALEDWNTNLKSLFSQTFLDYEFIDVGDPRFDQIVAGDPRFNVIEWDLKNLASYGGLGPHIANEQTGETISGITLIQGPKILELYKKWWHVSDKIEQLKIQGQFSQAAALKNEFENDISQWNKKSRPKFQIKNDKIHFNVASYDPRLADQAELNPYDFLTPPAGYTFETYMYGYFREMVAHELGHNFGLRHNFKGNLAANNSGAVGSVSRSIMEYQSRAYRYLNRIGEYDVMAMAYGYLGVMPPVKTWFCTDDDKASHFAPENSAECSSSDATGDPLGLFQTNLQRAKSYILLPGSEIAPEWTVKLLKADIDTVLSGIMNYAVSAPATGSTWTNFSTADRNITAQEAPQYITQLLEKELCDTSIEQSLDKKSPEGLKVAKTNLSELRTLFAEVATRYKGVAGWQPQFSCTQLN